MPLDENYLVYPFRSYGMDQDRYAWRLSIDRPKITWPGEASLACMIVVPIEHHMLNPNGKPFKHPGAMVTPYPDLRHYTTRDYGNRVGVFRILNALRRYGLKATVPINGRCCTGCVPWSTPCSPMDTRSRPMAWIPIISTGVDWRLIRSAPG